MNIIPQLLINSIIAASLYSLLAIGFNLIYKVGKFFDLGYGVMTAVAGYVVYLFVIILNLPIWFGILSGIITAGIVGSLLYFLVYSPLRARKASSMVLLVASLGVFTALQALIALIFNSQFKTLSNAYFQTANYTIGGGTITKIQLYIILTLILVFILILLLLKKTKLGRAIRAIGDDEEVAKVVGINTNKIIGIVFFLGSLVAGLAGVLYAFDTGIEPTMGLRLLLKGVIAAIIGGVGSITGGVLGGFLLGFVENFGIWKISGEWKDAIAFILLIVFLIFRPEGIIKKK